MQICKIPGSSNNPYMYSVYVLLYCTDYTIQFIVCSELNIRNEWRTKELLVLLHTQAMISLLDKSQDKNFH